MTSRLWSRLLIVASIGILAGVTYYLMSFYRVLRHREHTISKVAEIRDLEGECAALVAIAEVRTKDRELTQSLMATRARLVAKVVGQEDLQGRKVLAIAMRDELIDHALCEHIQKTRETGAAHPAVTILKLMSEGGKPCEQERLLSDALDGLGEHGAKVLHLMMARLDKLACLSPQLADKLATATLAAASKDPDFVRGLDLRRVAPYLAAWSPLAAAQHGCAAVAGSGVRATTLQKALGCTKEMRQDVLVHYRVLQEVSSSDDAPAVAAGEDVVLLDESGPFCTVMLAKSGPPRTLSCRALKLTSDLTLAARIEALQFGRLEADLIAGVASYDGETGAVNAVGPEPAQDSWYAYGSEGEPLGRVRRVDLLAAGARLGEEMPEEPLRDFCKRVGAKYCYDVDWAHAVTKLADKPVLFLSRPAAVFVPPASLPLEDAKERFKQAFGRDPQEDTVWSVYTFGQGSELLVRTTESSVSLRYCEKDARTWRGEEFGGKARANKAATAKLLAVLDLQQDGRPELLLRQRSVGASARQGADELLLLQARTSGKAFEVLNRLVVREY